MNRPLTNQEIDELSNIPEILTKRDRVKICNDIIIEISKRSRRFFYNEEDDTVSHFLIENNNRVYFWLCYSKKKILIQGDWIKSRNFPYGSTLNRLAIEMKNFIINGKKKKKSGLKSIKRYGMFLGWGYDDQSADEIMQFAKEVGYLE